MVFPHKGGYNYTVSLHFKGLNKRLLATTSVSKQHFVFYFFVCTSVKKLVCTSVKKLSK